ncbi:hypothetical protein GQ607_015907 [Colletotrichum asianum]|uniref:Uncharacterized protein n=1 Tax=Colletotrichum asianum TaxID=702518 RepID=A0A8H3W241_9PEZI|nr:hypothetical protein GQ607_015907 [Colletotrichum asianum]
MLLYLDNLTSNLTLLKKLRSLYSIKDLKIKLKIRLLRSTALKTSFSILTLLLRLIINFLNVIKKKVKNNKD